MYLVVCHGRVAEEVGIERGSRTLDLEHIQRLHVVTRRRRALRSLKVAGPVGEHLHLGHLRLEPWERAQPILGATAIELAIEEFNQRSSLIWTTARRLKEFLFGNFDVLLIDASSLAEKATFGAPQRVLSPPHAALLLCTSAVSQILCIHVLLHAPPLSTALPLTTPRPCPGRQTPLVPA
jgi:hypothetical protein